MNEGAAQILASQRLHTKRQGSHRKSHNSFSVHVIKNSRTKKDQT